MSADAERPEISIVIPSRDNRERLGATLESARRLEFDPDRFEVIVEDDGSTDGTLEAFRERSYPFHFEIARGEHGNQSAATNAAVARSRGRLLLCAASDLIFDEKLLTRHVEAHRRDERRIAVLGFLPYLPQLDERPFMYYLMNGGPQFGYTQIRDPRRLGPNFCYAPNFSLQREDFDRIGGFDSFFRYGGQDTDLGYRLVADGVRMVYEPEAVAWHDHPTDPDSYASRQHAAGVSSALLAERYPELEGGAPLWDAAISAWLTYPEAMLERDRCVVEMLEPLVARQYPRFRQIWNAVAVKRSANSETLSTDDRELFDRTRSLFSAYERMNRYWWAEAFITRSLERSGPEEVRRRVGERFLKRQATLQSRRVAERRLATAGIEISLVEPCDVFDTLILEGLRSVEETLATLAGFLSPQDGWFNRELIVILPPALLDETARRRLTDVAEVVESDCPARGLVEAFRRSRGDHLTVRRADADEESSDARWVVDRIFERISELRIISGGSRDAVGRLIGGHAADGTPIVVSEGDDAAGIVPLAAATPAHWSIRGDDARAIAAARPERLGERRDVALAAAIAEWLGGQVCFVPNLTGSPNTATAEPATTLASC